MLIRCFEFSRFIVLSSTVLAFWWAMPSQAAGPAVRLVQVDVELVLAVDVSWSMTKRELEIQRRGYAEALSSPAVAKAVASGPIGRIALTYIEWGGEHWRRSIVDWTLIENHEALKDFAGRLTIDISKEWRKTSISGAIDHAVRELANNRFTSLRQIIDVSGDGPNNDGRPVREARAAALAKGVTINGLPLMTRDARGQRFHLEDLDEYYKHCVIGGPGAFIVPVQRWEEFPEAVRRKLVLELAQNAPMSLRRVAYKGRTATGYDCLIGEKIWEEFFRRNILP